MPSHQVAAALQGFLHTCAVDTSSLKDSKIRLYIGLFELVPASSFLGTHFANALPSIADAERSSGTYPELATDANVVATTTTTTTTATTTNAAAAAIAVPRGSIVSVALKFVIVIAAAMLVSAAIRVKVRSDQLFLKIINKGI